MFNYSNSFTKEKDMEFSKMTYCRPNLAKLERSYARITQAFEQSRSAEEQYRLILEHEKLFCSFRTMASLALIRSSININDKYYDGEMSFINASEPVFTGYQLNFYRAVAASPLRKGLEKYTGSLFFTNIGLSLKAFSPETVELQKRENALETEYEKLLASAKISFRGKILNLSELQKYSISPDRSIRREAWQKTAGFFLSNSERLDSIYDELVKNRTEQAHRLGYQDYVQLGYDRLGRNCYGPGEVKKYREQIVHDLVPKITELKKRQAKRLGLPDIKFWDDGCLFPDGNPVPQGSTAELVDDAQQMYHEMSPLTGEFFDYMKQNGLFDLESKKGKEGGGYCDDIPDYKSPFIFSNFNGTAGDVEVLTHEAGHAFASYLALRSIPLLEMSCPTMDAAETHSMSMELFARPWDKLFFGKSGAEKFHQYQLESALDFIPYGCLVDHFQTEMYRHPEFTPEERKQVWLKLEHLYRPWIDFADMPFFNAGGGYQRQHHIYSSPLYYIDYCLAQTTALEFGVASEKNWKEAFSRYLAFVKAGGTKTYIQLVESAGLELPFHEGCISRLCAEIGSYL